MSLFSPIDPTLGNDSISAAVKNLVSNLSTLPVPRSLCEVLLDDGDRQWLHTWAREVSARTVTVWLNSFGSSATTDGKLHVRGVEAIGLLLLLHATEIGRAEAQEGRLWSVMPTKFSAATRRVLFVNGQPREGYKEAIERAAIRFKLRHVFGVLGVQYFYETIYLQFGFTKQGIAKLPYWLSGQQPSEAIKMLLDETGTLGSTSFQSLWRDLRDYRRNNITEQQLRHNLLLSPWVVHGWVDDVVRETRAKLNISILNISDLQGGDGSPAFLASPELRWDQSSDPYFECQIANLAIFDLSSERYEVRQGDQILATLLRQPDGSYVQPGYIKLDVRHPQHVVQLVDEAGDIAASQSVSLWDGVEEVNVYAMPSGKRKADAWRDSLATHHPYCLLISNDLDVNPPVPSFYVLTAAMRRLVYLPGGWPHDLKVTLNGQELWTPNLGRAQRLPAVEPPWAASVRVVIKGGWRVDLGHIVQPAVDGLDGTMKVNYVRIGSQHVPFQQQGQTVLLDSFQLTPQIATEGVVFAVGLERGSERTHIKRTLALDIRGVAKSSSDGWETVPNDCTLSVHEARNSIYRQFLPIAYREQHFDDLALFEGYTFTSRLRRAAHSLGTLAGYGAPLQILPNAFNVDRRILRVAASVVSTGVIRSVTGAAPGELRIHLLRVIEPGPEHAVLIWPRGGAPKVVAAEEIECVGDALWVIHHHGLDARDAFVSVTYDGTCLGSWWPAEPGEGWPVSPKLIAGLIRWMHLPVLSPTYRPVVKKLLRQHPAETLTAWLRDTHVAGSLVCGELDEAWLSAVRQICWDWKPSSEESIKIVAALTPKGEEPPVDAFTIMTRVNPVLARDVLRHWLTDDCTLARRTSAVNHLRSLRRDLAGLDTKSAEREFPPRLREIARDAARLMQVDDMFLDRSVITSATSGAPLPLLHKTNVLIALGMAPFRDYLTLHVLGTLA